MVPSEVPMEVSVSDNSPTLAYAAALAVARFEEERMRLWQEYFGEEAYRYNSSVFHKLALELYQRHTTGRIIYKTAAGRLMRVQHSDTASKHLNELEKRGWLLFVPDSTDGRKIQVEPTETLLALLEKYLSALTEKIRAFKVPPS